MQNTAPTNYIVTIQNRLRHTDNVPVKVRIKIKESGSNENNFSKLALQQNTSELNSFNTKKD